MYPTNAPIKNAGTVKGSVISVYSRNEIVRVMIIKKKNEVIINLVRVKWSSTVNLSTEMRIRKKVSTAIVIVIDAGNCSIGFGVHSTTTQ